MKKGYILISSYYISPGILLDPKIYLVILLSYTWVRAAIAHQNQLLRRARVKMFQLRSLEPACHCIQTTEQLHK